MEYLDAAQLGSRKINALLKEKFKSEKKIKVKNPHSLHNIAVGLEAGELIIAGNTGFYAGGFLDGASLTIEGNAGWYTGDNMMDGEIIIKKNAGCNLGVYQGGGTIVVYGNVGSRVAYGMKGGTTIVCGSAGMWAGKMILGGRLIILGEIGREVGESMYKGVIYLKDKAAESKLGGNVFIDDLKAAEITEINQLFASYDIDAEASELKALRPLTSGRHQYQLFEPDLKAEAARKYCSKSLEELL
ncbi:glutamate synthase [Halanaerobium hydrogeniformans]|uniref:Glutamate synthase alpha subunit domain protein n=1 Tax=Halanaerobium hydrogeniformans TaxID=656519 RepID=E4RP03_HALHG|nr:glutamate synthase [Halanaerobium hydrogeniformans]ADQ13693.1 glutamate synthase alpha subunit domain protein [Halanaerobium hydrogeniformans]